MDTMTKSLVLAWTVANQAADHLKNSHPAVRILPNGVTGLEAFDNGSDFPAIRILMGAATTTIQLVPTFGGQAIDVVASDNNETYTEGCPLADLDVDFIMHVFCRHQVQF